MMVLAGVMKPSIETRVIMINLKLITMKQNISNHRSRAGRMKNFFTANNSLIEPNTDIIDEIDSFNVLLTQFDDFAMKQQHPITA